MLPIHAQLVQRATESHAQSALPGAPVVPVEQVTPRLRRGASSPPV